MTTQMPQEQPRLRTVPFEGSAPQARSLPHNTEALKNHLILRNNEHPTIGGKLIFIVYVAYLNV